MKCKIICDLLPMYIDEMCSDETKEAVEEHLKTCSECRMEYEKMRADISVDKAEDLDEKELLKKGRETMTEYVKEKLYRRFILGDTILNLLIIISIIVRVVSGVMDGSVHYEAAIAVIPIGLIPLGIFFVSDIIYWVQYLKNRREDGSVIIDTICKMSLWMKLMLSVYAVAAAAVTGFYTMFQGLVWY